MSNTKRELLFQKRISCSPELDLSLDEKQIQETMVEFIWFYNGTNNVKFLIDNNHLSYIDLLYNKYSKEIDNLIKYYDLAEIIEESEYFHGWFNNWKQLDKFTKDQFLSKLKTDFEFSSLWADFGMSDSMEFRNWGIQINYDNDDRAKISHQGKDQFKKLLSSIGEDPENGFHVINIFNPSNVEDRLIKSNWLISQFFCQKLTYEESSALIVALNSLLLSVDNHSKEQILNLIAKLVKISERVDPIVSIDISTLTKNPEIELIDKAIHQNLQLSIDYYSPTTDTLTSRVIAPLEYLETSSGKKYVYAWCYAAEDFRQFKLERIRAVRDTQEKAHKLEGSSKSRGTQKNFIELELNEKALWFAEEWGIQNLGRNQSDEGFIGTVNLHNHDWAVRAVLALGGELRIPKDQVLRKEVADRAAAALANYAS